MYKAMEFVFLVIFKKAPFVPYFGLIPFLIGSLCLIGLKRSGVSVWGLQTERIPSV